jgi:hypothetical protein
MSPRNTCSAACVAQQLLELFADIWPFSGTKSELLEGSVRIPAVISWPDRVPQGRTTDQVAISVASQPKRRAIHVIAGNLSNHKTQAVRTFLLEHPNVRLHSEYGPLAVNYLAPKQ